MNNPWEDLFWSLRYELEDAVLYKTLDNATMFIEIGKALQRSLDRADKLKEIKTEKTPEILNEKINENWGV